MRIALSHHAKLALLQSRVHELVVSSQHHAHEYVVPPSRETHVIDELASNDDKEASLREYEEH